MGFGDKFKKLFKSGKNEEGHVGSEKDNSDDELIDYSTVNENDRNFKYLGFLINSGVKEIVLDSDIILDDDEESIYSLGIEIIDDDVLIDGNGYSIDAKEKTGIFKISGRNIKIKNITFKNAICSISNKGKLTVEDSTFLNNVRKFSGNNREGAIFNSGELSVVNSVFSNNNAQNGGAIQNISDSKLNVIDSQFNENNGFLGGAINNWGILNIKGSTFEDNTSINGAGAIFNRGNLNISDSSFSGNMSKQFGGAIYNYNEISQNQALVIKNSTFSHNTAVHGGAAIFNEGMVKMFNCDFLRNDSQNIIRNKDYLQIYNTKFSFNPSNQIIFNENKGNMGIFSCEFIDNDVGEAVIYNDGKNCLIEKSIFENNIDESKNIINEGDSILINPKIKEEGKTIFNKGNILFKNTSFDIEEKIENFGRIDFEGDSVFDSEKFNFGYFDDKIHKKQNYEDEFVKITFTGKTKIIELKSDLCLEEYESHFYEGGIELDIDDLIIDGCGKTIDGGDKSRIFHVTGNNITLKNIQFKNGYSRRSYDNPLNNDGGSLRIIHNIKLTIIDCCFIKNKSEENGGAISNSGILNVMNSTFSINSAEESGGAIINWGMLKLDDSVLARNWGASSGAVFNRGNMEINESSLCKNSVRYSGRFFRFHIGGAISNYGKLDIVSSNVSNNKSEDMAGAIYNSGDLSIQYTELSNNNSNKTGGAIFNKGMLNIIESEFTNNEAHTGAGAIFNSHGAESDIIDSNFSKNITRRNGYIAINNVHNAELRIKRCHVDTRIEGKYKKHHF